MKKDIHPEYMECTVRCSCGNTFKTRSTKPELRVELCNECHPFFTGQQKFVDTGGRVQRFSDKFGSASAATLEREAKKKAERKAAAEAAEAKKKAERAAKAAEKAKRAAEYAAKAKSEEPKPAEDQAAQPASDEGAEEPEAVADEQAPEEASAE
ncbi:MAG: 50S ribosomal protein L31 [Coriobacteriales bacterium]